MFQAIHKETKNIVWSFDPNYSEEFMKSQVFYAIPSLIEQCNSDIDKNTIEVKFRNGCEEVINKYGTIYPITPHFYIPGAAEKGIIITKDYERHEKAVSIIYNLIHKGKFKILVNRTKEQDKFTIMDTSLFDISKMSTEVTIQGKGKVRADLLLPFKEKNIDFGFGIIFEIQLTKQSATVESIRSYERAESFYSVCWINYDDFDGSLRLVKDYVEVTPYSRIMWEHANHQIERVKEITINYAHMIDERCTAYEKRIDEKSKLFLQNLYVPVIEKGCPKCHNLLVLRNGSFGNYYKCVACNNNISVHNYK